MQEFSFQELPLKGAYLINNFAVGDNRGGFAKTFEKDVYHNAGIEFTLNETFISVSSKNVIRGMHFQIHNPQAKLVSVCHGSVYDVIVDLRPNSETYKRWYGHTLSAENHKAIYIPKGFAHGFLALENDTLMVYQCDGAYDKATDTGIRFDDPTIGVDWPIGSNVKTIHSERDLSLMSLEEYEKKPMEL